MDHQLSQIPFPFACQRWRDRRTCYRPAGETIRPADYEIHPISMSEAKAFVTQHHYTHSYPSCRFRYGLFSNRLSNQHWQDNGLRPELVGVAVMSVPQHPAVLTNVFPGSPDNSTDLGRFILLDSVPANGETYFLARCRELLRKEGIIGMIAFSDDQPRIINNTLLFPGHQGTIYQASVAVLLGRGAPKTLHLFSNGQSFEPRAISKLRKKKSGWEYASEILIKHGADKPGKDTRAWVDYWLPRLTTSRRHPGNLKYAWSLHRSIVLPPSRAYPKAQYSLNATPSFA
jgi:hypothetical protein